MIPPLDPFVLKFDSIEIDPASGAAASAYEHALALAAPSAAAPEVGGAGFYLLNDAGGRFVVDRDIGVISLRDEALLASERGAVHAVRLRVVEPSGARYEIDLELRVTGMVPHVAGAEDLAAPAETVARQAPQLTPATRIALAVERPTVAWASFTAIQGGAPAPISHCGGAPYGSLLSVSLPAVNASFASLVLMEKTPAPAPRGATWTI